MPEGLSRHHYLGGKLSCEYVHPLFDLQVVEPLGQALLCSMTIISRRRLVMRGVDGNGAVLARGLWSRIDQIGQLGTRSVDMVAFRARSRTIEVDVE